MMWDDDRIESALRAAFFLGVIFGLFWGACIAWAFP